MKVTPIEEMKQFKPFNIVIESVQEASLIASLVGATTPSIGNEFGVPHNALCDLWHELASRASGVRPRLSIEIV